MSEKSLAEEFCETKGQFIAKNIDACTKAMQELGIKGMRLEYSGSGDSGDYMDLTVEGDDDAAEKHFVTGYRMVYEKDGDGQKEFARPFKTSLKSLALGGVFERLMDEYHSGYENDNGGGGEMYLDKTGAFFTAATTTKWNRNTPDQTHSLQEPPQKTPSTMDTNSLR